MGRDRDRGDEKYVRTGGWWGSLVRASQGNFDWIRDAFRALVTGHNDIVDDVIELQEYLEGDGDRFARAEQAAADVVISDHGALTGLGDDDHPQYLTEAEGDAAYSDITEPIAAAHITDAVDAHDASAVSVLDTAANFVGTDVEAVLAELAAGGGGSDGSDHNVLDHADANVSPAPNNGDVLTWDSTPGEWVAAAAAAAGTAAFVLLWNSKVVLAANAVSRRIYVPWAGTITGIYISVPVAPTGTFQVDIKKNGTSLYTVATKPQVTVGNLVSSSDSVPDTTTFAAKDYFTIHVDTLGGVTTGRALVYIVCEAA